MRNVRLFALLIFTWAVTAPAAFALVSSCDLAEHLTSSPHHYLAGTEATNATASHLHCESGSFTENWGIFYDCSVDYSSFIATMNKYGDTIKFYTSPKFATLQICNASARTIPPHERPPRLV